MYLNLAAAAEQRDPIIQGDIGGDRGDFRGSFDMGETEFYPCFDIMAGLGIISLFKSLLQVLKPTFKTVFHR